MLAESFDRRKAGRVDAQQRDIGGVIAPRYGGAP
jgi:hypothetical protein